MGLWTSYQNQISQYLAKEGLGDLYFAKVKKCTNLQQIFKALQDPEAKHFAVLSHIDEPVVNSFEYIKDRLSAESEVPLALIYQKSS